MVSNLISIGVDVGSRNGAIAVVDENLVILKLCKAPYFLLDVKSKVLKPKLNKETGKYEKRYKSYAWTDYTKLRELYKPFLKNNIIYTVERVSVRPTEGETNSFNFGNSLGVHEGQYSYLNPIEYYEPTPNTWKKELGVTSDKSTSIGLAERIYNCNLKDYIEKGKVDDIGEALLLAFYGFKKYYENKGEIK